MNTLEGTSPRLFDRTVTQTEPSLMHQVVSLIPLLTCTCTHSLSLSNSLTPLAYTQALSFSTTSKFRMRFYSRLSCYLILLVLVIIKIISCVPLTSISSTHIAESPAAAPSGWFPRSKALSTSFLALAVSFLFLPSQHAPFLRPPSLTLIAHSRVTVELRKFV